jgi:hypothetical protein
MLTFFSLSAMENSSSKMLRKMCNRTAHASLAQAHDVDENRSDFSPSL